MSLSRIDSNSIAANAISAVDLADGSITSAKIEANAITSVKIEANAITSVQIAANAITSLQVAANAITSTELAANLDLTGKTVTLPAGVGGKVLQVVSTTKTNVFSTASTSFVDVTGLSVAITPSSASSTILIMFSFYMSSNSAGGYPQARILRDSTAIYIGDVSGSRTRAITNTGGGLFSSDAGTGFNISAQFVDSPASTSSTTYKIQLLQTGGSSARIGASGDDTDSSSRVRTASSITVMEIAA